MVTTLKLANYYANYSSAIAVGLACIASIIQIFAPTWLFLAFIIASMLSGLIGFWITRRHFKREMLIAAMDQAFGIPADRPARTGSRIGSLHAGPKP